MILIFEALLFIIGIWALIAGKIPEKLNKILFGKHATELSENRTRLIGMLFISPLVVAFFLGFILAFFFNQDSVTFLGIFEFLYLLFIVFVVTWMVKKEKEKKQSSSETIDLQAQDQLSSLEDQE